MNIFKKGFLALFFISFSCEDVIKLDLKNASPRIVFESYIDVNKQSAFVLISKSNGFYENKPIDKVSNATILLKNDKGISYEFYETSSGEYTSKKRIITKPNEQWTIKITVDGKTYTAKSTTPYPTTLSKLTAKKDKYALEGDNLYNVVAEWDSKIETKNYYRIRYTKSSTSPLNESNYILVKNEDAINKKFKITLPDSYGTKYTVSVDLLSISEEYYNYFRQLANIQFSQTPYNPKGNFNNNALGYFGIFSISKKEITI